MERYSVLISPPGIVIFCGNTRPHPCASCAACVHLCSRRAQQNLKRRRARAYDAQETRQLIEGMRKCRENTASEMTHFVPCMEQYFFWRLARTPILVRTTFQPWPASS